ncbi:MAG: EAL domain-containing protein [Enterobacterales bacterium]|nr:EAL domain-containing protein [Enterobacterales bacterium]
MWATTNVGMVSIDTNSFQLKRYSFYDGLQGDEFNRAGLISKKGYMYFGGINGFNRFYPNGIISNIHISPPKITGLSVANKDIRTNNSQNPTLNQALLTDSNIFLTYDQTPFSIEFTSPQFVKPSDIQFRYRLLGLSDKWIISAKNSRRATYTNIPPGDYTFELQVRDINDEWNSFTQKKYINIEPPWWLSIAAKLFYGLIISIVLSVIFYLNWKRLQEIKKNVIIKEKAAERLRLSLWGGGNELWDWDIPSGRITRSDEDKSISIQCEELSPDLHEIDEYVHPDDRQKVKMALNFHLNGFKDHFEAVYRIKDNQLKWRWIQDRGRVVELDENDHPTRMSGTQKDISEMQRKDEEIERLGQAFKKTSDGVWIRNKQWQLIDCNPSYEKITGYSLSEKKGEALWFPETREQVHNLLGRIKETVETDGTWQGEAWAERKNNTAFPQKLTVDRIMDEKGRVRYYVGVFSDITYLKKSEKELVNLANYDSLTGLANRVCLYDRLTQNIEKTKIRKERFAVIHIDLNNFKRFNDTYSHSVGDSFIAAIGKKITLLSNETDTIARLGGDEFIIVRDHLKSSSQVAAFVEDLISQLSSPTDVLDQQVSIDITVGIAMYPEDGLTTEKLLSNANTALLEAKKEVDSHFQFFSEELNKKAKKRLVLENELRLAIEQDEIQLAYQPKVNMVTGRVLGVEALARWIHPELGFISPTEFILIAEECSMINLLGEQLLRKAIRQTKQWVDQGLMRGRTSVNLSAHQFWHRDLVHEIASILEQEKLDTKYLELELTESACVQEVEKTVKQLLDLRQLGIHLALDDFGTGYSSLAQLKILPLDTLKVDRDFVKDIGTDPREGKIVKAVIDIAKGLDLDVVVEGVETKEQCEYLWQNNAKIIQGYFFSKPVTPEAMTELFSKSWPQSTYLSPNIAKVTPINRS